MGREAQHDEKSCLNVIQIKDEINENKQLRWFKHLVTMASVIPLETAGMFNLEEASRRPRTRSRDYIS